MILLRVVAIGFILCIPLAAAETSAEKIKKLQVERYETAKKAAEFYADMRKSGTRTDEDAFQARSVMLEAKLDICANKAERLAVFNEMAALMTDRENSTKAQYEIGRLGKEDVMKLKVERLALEIRTEKEKAAQ